MSVKKFVSYILLISFVFQMGQATALRNIFQRIISEICAYYNTDSELSFFDYVFDNAMCENENNEKEAQKTSNDFIFKLTNSNIVYDAYETEQTSYIAFSSLLPSGFYFSLIQPPD